MREQVYNMFPLTTLSIRSTGRTRGIQQQIFPAHLFRFTPLLLDVPVAGSQCVLLLTAMFGTQRRVQIVGLLQLLYG